jgi:LPXTG-site transpeptidase (sortase) family protein
MRSRWNKLSLVAMSAGVGALMAAALLFGLSALGVIDNGDDGYSDIGTVTGFGNVLESLLTPTLPASPSPTPAGPPPSEAPVERLLIPNIEVDAPVVVMGIDANGVMQSPTNAWDVAWYDFSARPGFGGNAVFSGHVDYHDVGPAVFWDLRNLQEGDLISVRLADGTQYDYAVIALNSFEASAAPVEDIVGPTSEEVITIITCGGTFDSTVRQYSHRTVVRAQRVPEPPPELPPAS